MDCRRRGVVVAVGSGRWPFPHPSGGALDCL